MLLFRNRISIFRLLHVVLGGVVVTVALLPHSCTIDDYAAHLGLFVLCECPTFWIDGHFLKCAVFFGHRSHEWNNKEPHVTPNVQWMQLFPRDLHSSMDVSVKVKYPHYTCATACSPSGCFPSSNQQHSGTGWPWKKKCVKKWMAALHL